MRIVIINALCALLLMIAQSNFNASFGIDAMCQFGVIGMVLCCGLVMPSIASMVSMVVLGFACDLWASGPTGLYALVFSLVFIIFRAIMLRFRSERVVAMMIFAAIASAFFELLLAAGYGVVYRQTVYLMLFLRRFWLDAILSALFLPLVMFVVQLLDRLFSSHRKTGLT